MGNLQGIPKTMLLLVLLGVGLFFHHGVGVEGTRVLSMEEDLELEEELKLLNKPSVKTIQLEEGGDIFDCVDIYKQPAFDHPLLKDHKIQMQPSSYPSHKLDKNTTEDAKLIKLPKISCPPKTVPIRRVTKKDLIRMKAQSKREANHTRINYPSKSNTLYYSATLNTKEGLFYGTRAHLNVWAHDIYKEGWTTSQIFMRSGFDLPDYRLRNAIEAGWRVDPTLYGDSRTRTFIYWTGDGYVHTGCYNLLCPGFVQTNNHLALGIPISPLSTYQGIQYEIRLTIFKDPATSQWWLLMHDKEPIGYWPNTLFNNLRYSAFEVFWGGNAGNPPSPYFLSPPMGSGRPPKFGFGQAAYVDNIMLVDSNNTLYDPSEQPMHESVASGCYDLKNEGYVNHNDRYRIFYGGPGGCQSQS